MVAEDTTEGFLSAIFQKRQTGLVGPNIRITDSSKTPLTGSCDLFQAQITSAIQGKGTQTSKLYCFDQKTKLLTTVVYKRAGTVFETRYGKWQDFGGGPVPLSIQRIANGAEKFTLQFTAAQVLSAEATGIFVVQ